MPAFAGMTPECESIHLRARPADADAILEINERYARRGILLSRTRDEIAESIDTFRVCELDGEVVGIAALRERGCRVLRSCS